MIDSYNLLYVCSSKKYYLISVLVQCLYSQAADLTGSGEFVLGESLDQMCRVGLSIRGQEDSAVVGDMEVSEFCCFIRSSQLHIHLNIKTNKLVNISYVSVKFSLRYKVNA